MPGRGATLKDIAAQLDISVATASRALAGHDRIAPETRARVAEIAEAIGYVPNRAARALVSGRSGFAGLTLPYRDRGHGDAYLGAFAAGLTEGLERAGIDLFLAAVPEGRSELDVLRHLVETRRADGLVVSRVTETDPRVQYLAQHGFPFVAHGRLRDETCAFSWVDTDGRSAFAQAFDLLYDFGHRHFGFLTITEPMTFRHQRAAGLAEAAARRGDPSVRIDTAAAPRFDCAARKAAVRALLDRPDRPTAVIGLFDGLALAVMQEAAASGLRVPEDLSVIGFDNTPAAAYAPPGLTTFDSAIHDAAREAAAMLIRRIARPGGPPETRLLSAALVLRGSHGVAPRRAR